MLPFLKRNKEASVSLPPEHVMRDSDEGEYDGLQACAEDLIAAVHSKDIKSVAAALRAAFEICDSEPHEEGPHMNKEG